MLVDQTPALIDPSRSLLEQVLAQGLGPPETWPQQLHTVVGLVLQSRSPAAVIWGHGLTSKFTVHLPRLMQESSQTGQQNIDSPVQQETNSLRIMVVDDNVDAAAMLAMLLEAAGHQVMIEHGSRRALERASKERPQVCLLDIGLPEIDGNELAKRLRAPPETASSVLIAVTGYGQEQDHKQTLDAGFDHHLVKPVDTKKLAAMIAAASRV